MTIVRQKFSILTDTGTALVTKGDTGPPMWGELMQVYIGADPGWSDSGDTGIAVRLAVLPTRDVPGGTTDTGDGYDVFDLPHVRGTPGVAARRLISPRNLVSIRGADTGLATAIDTGTEMAPFILAGERLRIKCVAGTTLSDSGLPLVMYVYLKT